MRDMKEYDRTVSKLKKNETVLLLSTAGGKPSS